MKVVSTTWELLLCPFSVKGGSSYVSSHISRKKNVENRYYRFLKETTKVLVFFKNTAHIIFLNAICVGNVGTIRERENVQKCDYLYTESYYINGNDQII